MKLFSTCAFLIILLCGCFNENTPIEKTAKKSKKEPVIVDEKSTKNESFEEGKIMIEDESSIFTRQIALYFFQDKNVMDMEIDSIIEKDSIKIVEAKCSCNTPCLLKIIASFDLNNILIEAKSLSVQCDCPSDCEECGWNKLNRLTSNQYIFTSVNSESTPKSNDRDEELEYECDIVNTVTNDIYYVNSSGNFELYKSIVSSGLDDSDSTNLSSLEIKQMLNGLWVSSDDSDNYLFFNEGKRGEIGYGMDEWSEEPFELSASCLNETDNHGSLTSSKQNYLSCSQSNMCWFIVSVSNYYLELSYVGRGNTLKYKRLW